MLWSTRYRGCISTVWTILLLSQPTGGTRFVLRDVATGETMVRRACEPASPNVNVSSVSFLQQAVLFMRNAVFVDVVADHRQHL